MRNQDTVLNADIQNFLRRGLGKISQNWHENSEEEVKKLLRTAYQMMSAEERLAFGEYQADCNQYVSTSGSKEETLRIQQAIKMACRSVGRVEKDFYVQYGLNGLFKKMADARTSISDVLLMIQAMAKKWEFAIGFMSGRRFPRKLVEAASKRIEGEFDFLLSTHMLYKVVNAHVEQRIDELKEHIKSENEPVTVIGGASKRRRRSIGRDVASRRRSASIARSSDEEMESSVNPIEVFTEEEEIAAKSFLKTYFKIDFDNLGIKDFPCSPQNVYEVLQRQFGESKVVDKKVGAFFEHLSTALFENLGIHRLAEHFNKQKYGKNTTQMADSFDKLKKCLRLVFTCMFVSSEHNSAIEELSDELESIRAKKSGQDRSGGDQESVKSGFGQYSRILAMLSPVVMKLSNDEELKEQRAKLQVSRGELSYRLQSDLVGLRKKLQADRAKLEKELKEIIAAKDALIQSLSQTDKDAEIVKLSGQVNEFRSMESQYEALQEKHRELESRMAQFEQANKDLAEDNESRVAQNDEKDARIADLEAQIAALQSAKATAKPGGHELSICSKKCPAKVQEVLSGVVVAVGASLAAGGISLFIPQVASMMMGGAVNANPLAMILIVAGVLVGGLASLGVQQARVKNLEWKLKQQEMTPVKTVSAPV